MDLKLYGITDPRWTKNDDEFFESIRKALDGGVTMLQLREKDTPYEEFLFRAKEVKKICDEYKVPLIINDNVEIMEAVDAAGVHLGRSDASIKEVRKKYPKKIIGATVKTILQAILSKAAGASYFGVGAVNPSSTKTDAVPIDVKRLNEIDEAAGVPIVAIGGINLENMENLSGARIDGIAVSEAIFGSSDVEEGARLLKEKFLEMTRKHHA